MLHRGVLYLLILALALMVSPTVTPPPASAAQTLVVDDDGSPCLQTPIVFSTIQAALAAANPGDTIRVCEGDYWETQILAGSDYVTITGPGATPENDGVATVHLSMFAVLFNIKGDYVVLQGLVLDVTEPDPGAMTQAIHISGSSVSIEHNEIRNATSRAVYVYEFQSGRPRYVQILSNNIHDSNEGVICHADDCVISGNTVNIAGGTAIEVIGSNGNITSNVVVNGSIAGAGDDLFVSGNQISAGTANSALSVAGERVAITDNRLSDAIWNGIEVFQQPGGPSTSATIGRNTFTNIGTGIVVHDLAPSDAFTVTATIGGSEVESNTFVNSGGTMGDQRYLVEMGGPTPNVNAEYNNWGLCTAAEIEQEVYHQVDDPAQGLVDFEPFIAPSSCSATPTPTPTPTPTATATPPVGPTRTVQWGPGWHSEMWTGSSTPPEQAFACAQSKYAAAYRLVSGGWERYFPDRPDISNMGPLEQYGAFLILVIDNVTCQMPVADPPAAERLLEWDVGWQNCGWTGPDAIPPQDALACAAGSYAATYRLVTGSWERHFPDRPDISNMGLLNRHAAFLILVTAPVSCTMPVAP